MKKSDPLGENLLAKENIDQTTETEIVSPAPIVTDLPTTNNKMKINQPTKPFLKKKKLWLPLAIIGGLAIFLILFLVLPAMGVAKAANKLMVSARTVQDAVQKQDAKAVQDSLGQLNHDLDNVDKSLAPLIWLRPIPVLGSYWQDGKQLVKAGKESIAAGNILIPAIEPYIDFLGFKKGDEPGGEGAKTASDRIDFIVKSLPAILPKLDEVASHLQVARDAVRTVDPARYPENFQGKKVRENVQEIVTLLDSGTTFLIDGKPLLERLPDLLGTKTTKTYLVLFQNDKELRPTGGFMTAYSLMKVKNGKMDTVSSNDIYNLDDRYKPRLEAPAQLIKYLGGPPGVPYTHSKIWPLRDMNWSPDFKVAMDLFTKEAATAGIKNIDGVIAVDTEVLVGLLNVVGKIGVPGYGNYSAETDKRCSCPQVIYELETYADIEGPVVWDPNTGKIVYGRLLDNRKGIVGPLVNSIMANVMAQPKDKVADLFQTILTNLQGKHILFYMFDEDSQKALEAFNIAGRLKDTNGDYLAIVDSNLGGRKSNLYIQQEVTDNIKKSGDKIMHQLEITYKNPQKDDGWLNSVQRDYVRVYLPAGTKVIKNSGLKDESVSEDLSKSVFGGFFELRPQGVAKINLEYEVPLKTKDYTLLIQKQPGTPAFHYTVQADGQTKEFQLQTDQILRFGL
ncbi:DUF4012 domain-containing protein [Candidatus Microgenomates bacterium]|nr:DUF4012 domain-containing protein [Candidatus Microgenomates bacterium]